MTSLNTLKDMVGIHTKLVIRFLGVLVIGLGISVQVHKAMRQGKAGAKGVYNGKDSTMAAKSETKHPT